MQANKLKGLLVEKSISYEEMAERLSIGITAFANKVNGKSQFKLDELVKLKRELGLSTEQFDEVFFK